MHVSFIIEKGKVVTGFAFFVVSKFSITFLTIIIFLRQVLNGTITVFH